MRHFHISSEHRTRSRHDAEPRDKGRFGTAIEQPLHSQANAEHWNAEPDGVCHRLSPALIQGLGRIKMTNARNHERLNVFNGRPVG